MAEQIDSLAEQTERVAKSYVELAGTVSQAMLDATANQQKVQHAQMLETAELCARFLNST